MSKKAGSSARLVELDALRGLAALGVVLCHYTSLCCALEVIPFSFHHGSYGPHLFFMISGFVIFMTLGRTRSASGFVYSRFSRLFPVYWLAVIFSTSLILNAGIPGRYVTLTQFLGNLTMCQTWLGIADIEVSYWTLGVELKFYALMLCFFLFGRRIGIEKVALLWLLAIAAFRVADAAVGLPHFAGTPLILDYAHLFVAGIMFYQLRHVGPTVFRHTLIAAALPMQFLAAGMESTLVVAGFTVVFHLFNAGRLKRLASRPLVYLGGISYSLYLTHGLLGHAVIYWLYSWTASPWLLLTIPIAVAVCVGHVFTYYLERPALELLRSKSKRHRAGSNAAQLRPENLSASAG